LPPWGPDFVRSFYFCNGNTILKSIGHSASPCRSFWTISSSVTPPKKRRDSITENPLSRKISRQ
jgi:hypothetical protein